jgi:phosphatidate cytidylyltransferase
MTGNADAPRGGAGGGRPRQLSNLQLRVISAVVMVIAVLGLTWLGGLPFRLLAAGIAGAIFYEWTRMSRAGAAGPGLGFLPEALMLACIGALIGGAPAWILLLLTAAAVGILLVAALIQGAGQWETAGLAYAALSGISLALLRDGGSAGLTAILFLFAVVWATDILAYFVGRAIGGPKLAPAISPGKTWSGAIGGAVGGVLAGVILAALAGAGISIGLILIAFLLSAVSQAGDLFESWVKRRKGVKDSGNIIPGHGGVMDRVDGLVAAAFALYVIGWACGSADHPAQVLFPI